MPMGRCPEKLPTLIALHLIIIIRPLSRIGMALQCKLVTLDNPNSKTIHTSTLVATTSAMG